LARPKPPPLILPKYQYGIWQEGGISRECTLSPPPLPSGGVDSTLSSSSAQTFVPYISQCLLSRGTVVASPLDWLEHWTPCHKKAEPYQVTLG